MAGNGGYWSYRGQQHSDGGEGGWSSNEGWMPRGFPPVGAWGNSGSWNGWQSWGSNPQWRTHEPRTSGQVDRWTGGSAEELVSRTAHAERLVDRWTGGSAEELVSGTAHDERPRSSSRNSSGGSSREETVETIQHDSRSSGLSADYVSNVRYLSREFPALLDAVSTPIPSALVPAVADGIFDLEYFKNFRNFTGNYKQHSTALKWFRQILELNNESGKVFSNTEPEQIAHINHPKGTDFFFDSTRMHAWRWQEMIALLRAEDLAYVVCGESGSRGLRHCCVAPRKSYDHKRHHADKSSGSQSGQTRLLLIWDFIMVRDDGSAIRLHPNWSNTKVETFDAPPGLEDFELPRTGKGGTSGPGTFKYFQSKNAHKVLRFEASKIPQRFQ